MTAHTLAERIQALHVQLPQLIADHPDDADFWPAYAGLAEDVQAAADAVSAEVGLDTFEYLEAMLVRVGKRDGDEHTIIT